MSAHTPGPWIIDGGKKDALLMVYAEAGGMPGVIVNQGRIEPRDRANARLIAAAPDLLEALKAIVHKTPSMGGSTRKAEEHNAMLVAACVAIAKAEGK